MKYLQLISLRENNSPVYRDALIALTVVIVITAAPDMIFNLSVKLGHILVEFCHILFEVVESILDHLAEHLFQTNLEETQIIVFYAIVSAAGGLLYLLCRAIPRIYRQAREKLSMAIEKEKESVSICWKEMSLLSKSKLIAICASVMACHFLLFV